MNAQSSTLRAVLRGSILRAAALALTALLTACGGGEDLDDAPVAPDPILAPNPVNITPVIIIPVDCSGYPRPPACI